MRRIVSAIVLLTAVVVPGIGRAETWDVDPVHSTVGFKVRHMTITTVTGKFRTFSGKAVGELGKPEDAQIEATIDAASIDTDNEKRDTHLKSPDFFDVAQFPKITFKSKKIEPAGTGKYKVSGDLTMHGVTKPVVLDVEGPTAPVTMGNTKAGAHAKTRINRKDFGISWSKVMDGGGLVVSDEVDVVIDVEAVKKSE